MVADLEAKKTLCTNREAISCLLPVRSLGLMGTLGGALGYDDVSSRTQHPEIEAILVPPLKPGMVS